MRTALATAAVLFCLVVATQPWLEGRAQSAAPAQAPLAPSAVAASPQQALVNQYCMGCHSDRAKMGGLALSQLNLESVDQSAEIAEKVIRKLRGGLMPPAGNKRPESKASAEFVSWLENKIDTAAVASHPGRVALRRLNRREYGYAIRDLLALNIDPKAWLPDDNVKGNFDNNAAALQVSPNFTDQYIYAARAA